GTEVAGDGGRARQPQGDRTPYAGEVADLDVDDDGRHVLHAHRGRGDAQVADDRGPDHAVGSPGERDGQPVGAEQPAVDEQVAGDGLALRERREGDAAYGDQVVVDLRRAEEVGQAGRVEHLVETVHERVARQVLHGRDVRV